MFPGLPAEIYATRPRDGEEGCPRTPIGVDIRLTEALRKGSVFDISQITLTVDGVDVTQKAEVSGTRDFPQSQASLSFTPSTPLPLGQHKAALIYSTTSGRLNYAWTFHISEKPCQ